MTEVGTFNNCPNLKKLYLANNNISDIDFIQNLDLAFLELPWNKVSDISLLSTQSNLETLSIHDNPISDISAISALNKLNLIAPKGAFAYPFYVENGIEIRKALAQKKIYIPTLWPNVLDDMPKDSIEYDYAANILPLPCDQRYSIDDMKCLVGGIRKCIS